MSHPSVDVDLPAGGASAAVSPAGVAAEPTFHLSPSAAAAAMGLSSAPASPTVGGGAESVQQASGTGLPPRSQSISLGGTSLSNRVLYKGILTKLGSSLLSIWRTRFFVLRENDMTYYNSERDWLLDKAPLGRMRANGLRCWSQAPTDLEWKFVATDKTVVVRGTLDDKKAWYDIIDQNQQRINAAAVAEGRVPLATEANTDIGAGSTGRPPSPSVSRMTGSMVSAGGMRSRSGSAAERDSVAEEGADEMADLFTSARESAGPDAIHTRSTSVSSRSSIGGFASVADVGAATASTPSSKRTNSLSASIPPPTAAAAAPGTPIDPAEAERRRQKRLGKSRKAQQIFGWGPDELVIKDFSCALNKVIMLHGKMFITRRFIAFESTLFSGSKLCVPIEDVLSVCEANQAIIFPNALKLFVRVHAEDQLASGGAGGGSGASMDGQNSYFFGSFGPGGRQAALELITALLNNTFNPDKYGMGEASASAAAAAAGVGVASEITRQNSVSSSLISTDGEGDGDEDDEEGDEEGGDEGGDGVAPLDLQQAGTAGAGGEKRKLSSHLDFGEHRGSVSGAAGAAGGGDASEVRQLLDETLPGVSALAFWRLFVSDSALFTAEMYHQSRGHTEYQASGWKDARLVDGASSQGWTLVRDAMMRVPVVGAPMGPDSTRVLKVQKCSTAEAGKVRLETVAVTPDVPFGDCFVLVDEWSVTDVAGPAVGCRVRVQLSVRFVKSNWKLRAIKGMMLSRVFGENEAGFRAHVEAMRHWAETHAPEVAAVNKAVMAKAGGKGAGLSKAKSAATTAAATGSASTPAKATASGTGGAAPSATFSTASSSGAGFLDTLMARLPPSVQKLGVGGLAGMAVTLLLLIILSVWLLTSSGPAATAVATAAATTATIPVIQTVGAAAAADGAASTVIAVMPTASASIPWWATLLLSVLVAAIGGLAFRLQQIERDVATLKFEIKALKQSRN